jgi:hypothetical protein
MSHAPMALSSMSGAMGEPFSLFPSPLTARSGSEPFSQQDRDFSSTFVSCAVYGIRLTTLRERRTPLANTPQGGGRYGYHSRNSDYGYYELDVRVCLVCDGARLPPALALLPDPVAAPAPSCRQDRQLSGYLRGSVNDWQSLQVG